MNKRKLSFVCWAVVFAFAVICPFLFSSEYMLNLFCQALINMIVVLGLNFITGLTGNMNLGTAGIMGLGAYTSALLNTKLGLDPWLGLLAAIAIGYVIGQALGYPSLRIRGVYLSLTTIAFAEIVRLVLNNTTNLTNGTQGVLGIQRYNLFGYVLDTSHSFFYFLLVVVVLFVFTSHRLVQSKWGRAFKALSDNPDAAESLGINISKVKIQAFTLATIFASIAGALYAHYFGYINPSTYNFDFSVKYVTMLMIGGIGMVGGNLFGALIVTLLPEMLRFLGDYYLLVYYTIAFLGAVLLPEGWILGAIRLFRFVRRKIAGEQPALKGGVKP